MTCEPMPGGGIACNFTDKWTYICLEHTTYIMEFSSQFGPYWFRLDGKKEIDVFPDPDGNLSFLWDFFEEWHCKPVVEKSFMESMGNALMGKKVDNEFIKANL